nr:hypothetical protein KitaXyl93_44980 [Kitasatospora sp. Xyl93]
MVARTAVRCDRGSPCSRGAFQGLGYHGEAAVLPDGCPPVKSGFRRIGAGAEAGDDSRTESKITVTNDFCPVLKPIEVEEVVQTTFGRPVEPDRCRTGAGP